jgi:hypothetical protein
MRNFSSVRVTPALVISIIALVLAAGGTSYAGAPVAFVAKTLGLNGKQKSQAKSIAEKEIKAKASKLTVLSAKSATSAATAATAATAGTATSATTATTATTANAANALNGVVIVKGPNIPNPAATQSKQEVTCPAGLHAIGGGVQDDGDKTQSVNEMFIGSSETTASATNVFTAYVNNTGATAFEFHVWATCATVSLTGTAF